MIYNKFQKKDFKDLLDMGQKLWPDTSKKDFENIINDKKQIIFICRNDEVGSVGFSMGSIRKDHVEGSKTSLVGYVEGLYVRPSWRHKGVATNLVRLIEKWSKEKGCSEIGSDAELENINSQKFHKKIGFKEVNRTVSFIKKIK